MQTPPSETRPDHGLPPVAPPSAGAFLKLFVVPGLIVLVLVGLFLVGPTLLDAVNRLLGFPGRGAHSAERYVQLLDSENNEVRWRAASDLANELPRNEELARNVGFGLQLAERLDSALQKAAPAEEEFAHRVGSLSDKERISEEAKLDPGRTYITYLAGALAHFVVPVGVDPLKQMATQEGGMEPDALLLRRRLALTCLSIQGKNAERFDQLSAEQQEAVLSSLEAASSETKSARARTLLEYARDRQRGKQTTLGVVDVLEKCAPDDDPGVRELTAFTCNFWYGTPAEDERIEKILVGLLDDTGKGEEEAERKVEQQRPDQPRYLSRKPGYIVRINAAIALAWRGSAQVPLSFLRELLDADNLRKTLVVVPRNGPDRPDEGKVAKTLKMVLDALARLHKKRPELDLTELRDRVEALKSYPSPEVQTAAQQALAALDGR